MNDTPGQGPAPDYEPWPEDPLEEPWPADLEAPTEPLEPWPDHPLADPLPAGDEPSPDHPLKTPAATVAGVNDFAAREPDGDGDELWPQGSDRADPARLQLLADPRLLDSVAAAVRPPRESLVARLTSATDRGRCALLATVDRRRTNHTRRGYARIVAAAALALVVTAILAIVHTSGHQSPAGIAGPLHPPSRSRTPSTTRRPPSHTRSPRNHRPSHRQVHRSPRRRSRRARQVMSHPSRPAPVIPPPVTSPTLPEPAPEPAPAPASSNREFGL